MKKFVVLALAAAGLLALAATAQAKEITSLKVCGASGCTTVNDREDAPRLGGWRRRVPGRRSRPWRAAFLHRRARLRGRRGQRHPYGAGVLAAGQQADRASRTTSRLRGGRPRRTRPAMYEKAAAGLEAFTPKVKKVTVNRKTVADPSSYMRLFETFPYVALPKGKLHLISIVFTPDGVNPFLPTAVRPCSAMTRSAGCCSAGTATCGFHGALGKLVMTRASLAKTQDSGSGGGNDGAGRRARRERDRGDRRARAGEAEENDLRDVEDLGGEQRFRREQRDFDGLFRAHYPEIVRYLSVRLGSREEASDLASEVFLEAFRRVPGLRWRGRPVLAWLYRVAANMAADSLRKRGREVLSPELVESAAAEAPDPAATLPEREALARALASLPRRSPARRPSAAGGGLLVRGGGSADGAERRLVSDADAPLRPPAAHPARTGRCACPGVRNRHWPRGSRARWTAGRSRTATSPRSSRCSSARPSRLGSWSPTRTSSASSSACGRGSTAAERPRADLPPGSRSPSARSRPPRSRSSSSPSSGFLEPTSRRRRWPRSAARARSSSSASGSSRPGRARSPRRRGRPGSTPRAGSRTGSS